jgi:glycosyltransferase involved in cell wall biosynthesis
VKIIEAAGHGKAIVSTPMGAEGLDFTAGREIVHATTVRQLADECVGLLQDVDRAEKLGMAARRRALAGYDRSAIRDQLASLFRSLT